nr:hypothetical protein CFP56_21807 [Quercus suber]
MRFTPFLIAIIAALVHSQDFGAGPSPNGGKSVLIPKSVSSVAAAAAAVTPCYADVELKDTAPAPDGRETVAKNMVEEVLTVPTTSNGTPVTVAAARVLLHSGELQVRDASLLYVTMTEVVITKISVPIYGSNSSTKAGPAITGSSVSIPASSTMATSSNPDHSGNASTIQEITPIYTGPAVNVSATTMSSDLASRSDLTSIASIATSLASSPGWPSSTTSSIADGGAGFTGAADLVLASNASVIFLLDGFFPFLATYMLSTVVIGVAMVRAGTFASSEEWPAAESEGEDKGMIVEFVKQVHLQKDAGASHECWC